LKSNDQRQPAADSLPAQDEILIALRRIIQAIDIHSRTLMRDFGLTGPQLVVLREVGARGEISGSSLARTVAVSLPTLTGIVGRLEARALVDRRRGTEDKRHVLISITDQGREVLAEAPSPLQDRFGKRLAGLPAWEQTQMLSVLQRIVAMMEVGGLDATALLESGSGRESSGREPQ
jgi:DNA-binding MarR family transcriptional regulator